MPLKNAKYLFAWLLKLIQDHIIVNWKLNIPTRSGRK